MLLHRAVCALNLVPKHLSLRGITRKSLLSWTLLHTAPFVCVCALSTLCEHSLQAQEWRRADYIPPMTPLLLPLLWWSPLVLLADGGATQQGSRTEQGSRRSISIARDEEIKRLAGLKHRKDDFERVLFPPPGGEGPVVVRWEVAGTVKSTGRPYVAHVALVNDPRHFTIEPPLPTSCGVRVKTSVTASDRGCIYANNAGFFDMDTGECLGTVVSNGRVIQYSEAGYASLGVVAGPPPGHHDDGGDGSSSLPRPSWVLGAITTSTLKRMPLWQLVQGIGWLIRDGEEYVSESFGGPDVVKNNSFCMEKAPRTAVGVLRNGSVLLYQVDGQEDIAAGVDLFELVEVMMEEVGGGDLRHAINLDGGGSSVSWSEGRVISKPTCVDTAVVCERAVTTITCIRGEAIDVDGGSVDGLVGVRERGAESTGDVDI